MSLVKEMSERLKNNEPETSEFEAPENDFETIFFGLEPNKKFPTTVDLRFKNGSCKAIPYAYVSEIDFHPSEGIIITASGRKISITGRNLKRLYDYLASYRVRFIQANIGSDTAEDNTLFVDDISIEEI